MDAPQISLNMIVRDSASTIKRAIQSVKKFVDEIIIVDTGSTDATTQIAEELGAKVHSFKWIDNYSAARNFAIEKSTGDWILWLDDDEWIDEDNFKKLSSTTLSKDSYYRTHKIILQPQKFYSFQTSTPRIFPNRPDIRWRLRAHETLLQSLQKAGLIEKFLDVNVLNEGYEHNRYQKALYYKKLLEQDLAENPSDIHILFHLAQECENLKLVDEALKYYGECILNYPDEASSFLARAIPSYAKLLIQVNRLETAISVIMIGRDIFPNNPKLLDLHAITEKYCGRTDRAEQLWKELLTTTYDTSDGENTYHPTGVRLTALDRLATLYFENGRINESIEYWKKALALDPEYVPAIEGMKRVNRTG